MENYQIDNLDRGILDASVENVCTTYVELAKQFGISPGIIHAHVEKMKQAGVITGMRIDASPKQLSYNVGCFIGIIPKNAKDYLSALARLESFDEATETYYTIGHCNIFIKVMCKSIDALRQILISEIRITDEIQFAEALVALQNPITRIIEPQLVFLIPYFSTGRSQLAHSA